VPDPPTSKLQNFFRRELQVLGKQVLSGDLLSINQITQLTALQADTAAYVANPRRCELCSRITPGG
jgi:hypothetical protein